jgi:hypothetical protein
VSSFGVPARYIQDFSVLNVCSCPARFTAAAGVCMDVDVLGTRIGYLKAKNKDIHVTDRGGP